MIGSDKNMQTLTVKAREPSYSTRTAAPRGEPGLADIVKSTANDVVHLATTELRLLKLEMVEGARARIGRAVLMAVGGVPLVVAYLLGLGALVVWLRPLIGLTASLGAVALSQAILGGIIIGVALPKKGAQEWSAPSDPGASRDGGGSGA